MNNPKEMEKPGETVPSAKNIMAASANGLKGPINEEVLNQEVAPFVREILPSGNGQTVPEAAMDLKRELLLSEDKMLRHLPISVVMPQKEMDNQLKDPH
jgi:hypothetical protein